MMTELMFRKEETVWHGPMIFRRWTLGISLDCTSSCFFS